VTELDTAGYRVVLEGAQTIGGAEDARARLLAALAGHSRVEVDCSAATEIDLSVVQLILAARKSALAAGKRLVLAQPAAGVLRGVLERGGFLPSDGGSRATDEETFWSKGDSCA